MHIRPLAPIDAIDAAARLSGLAGLTFLDSARREGGLGRHSYLAADPFAVWRVADGRCFWNGHEVALEGVKDGLTGTAALAFLRQRLADYPLETLPGLPPFQGGAVGYLAYEFGHRLERLRRPATAATGVAEAELHFHDVVIAFDHASGEAFILSSGWPETEPDARATRAIARADAFAARLAAPAPPSAPPVAWTPVWRQNLGRAGFEAAVARTIDHILDGDIFQANIAERFETDLPGDFDAFALYKRLRALNPAPFAAWLDWGELRVASSSPERFLRLDGGGVETRPIKGTRRRSADPDEDAMLAAELLASEKDRAENVMIVDLMRSDLSRVSAPGSVEVSRLAALESYSNVHHLVSTVTGRLEAGRDGLDLVAATFPGGSITGAPRIAAMQVIAALEGVERGLYCGSIGWLGFDGNADLNIAIRTATLAGGVATVSAGSGITALSDPAAEYDEATAKAARLLAAFGTEGGQ
jgi:para-aminobenzoate synthetase component 1